MTEETLFKSLPINEWAEDDRPREKLLLKGRAALSDAELLAILISTGTRDESALSLSMKILQLTENNLNELGRLTITDYRRIKGIGEAKALTLIAALELGRRRKHAESQKRVQITCSRDSYEVLYPFLSDLHHEEFWIILLNRNNKILGQKRISEGGISGTVVDSRLIFKPGIELLASSIILCHNHPSGQLTPSNADIQLTRKLKEAGKLLDINILDHLIIGDNSYFSFADDGML